jgi:hypothetical protein
LDKLVGAWGKVDKRAKLWVRAPDNAEKTALMEQARELGLIDQSVFFPEAVPEADLIIAAREADIGLIPYEPTSLNNRYCCPNKLSQYMAAGLPIICNMLDYVRSIVEDNGIGTSVDFSDEAALIKTIDDYVARRDKIPALSRKAQEVFRTSFNWESVSLKTYAHIRGIAGPAGSKRPGFDFAWIDGADARGSELLPQEELIATLNDEIRRLNEVYTEHQIGLQAELDRLNKVYPEEIARLNKVLAEEVQRLSTALAREVERNLRTNPLRAVYHRLRRLARLLKGLPKALTGGREGR